MVFIWKIDFLLAGKTKRRVRGGNMSCQLLSKKTFTTSGFIAVGSYSYNIYLLLFKNFTFIKFTRLFCLIKLSSLSYYRVASQPVSMWHNLTSLGDDDLLNSYINEHWWRYRGTVSSRSWYCWRATSRENRDNLSVMNFKLSYTTWSRMEGDAELIKFQF